MNENYKVTTNTHTKVDFYKSTRMIEPQDLTNKSVKQMSK